MGKVTKPRVWRLPDSHLYLGGAGGLPETCLPLSQAWKKSKGSRCSYSVDGEGCEGLPSSALLAASSADQGNGRGGTAVFPSASSLSLHLEVSSASSRGYPLPGWRRVWPWEAAEGGKGD